LGTGWARKWKLENGIWPRPRVSSFQFPFFPYLNPDSRILLFSILLKARSEFVAQASEALREFWRNLLATEAQRAKRKGLFSVALVPGTLLCREDFFLN
jgi:hypothetical protein